jgi:hypothetical protein
MGGEARWPPGQILHACENEEGYPPFTFRGPDGRPQGYSVDLLTEAIAGSGLTLDVSFLPPRRCSMHIDSGQLDLFMEETWVADQATRWLPSDAAYEATQVLFYDRARYPGGLPASEVLARPDQYPGCGLLGFVYAGFPQGQIRDWVHHYADAFPHLLHGDCAFFPEYLEFGAAFRLEGRPILDDPRFGWVINPQSRHPELRLGLPPQYRAGDKSPFFFYLRRDFPSAETLIARIDATIGRWRQGGREREELARYIDVSILDRAR